MAAVASKNFFDDGSPYLGHPLLTPERTALEIDEVEQLTGSTLGRVLDIGCGFGRHSIELASRGAIVTGIDPSPAMIAAATPRRLVDNTSVEFICSAASQLEFDARFDLAICLFTTFGQLDGPRSDDSIHRTFLDRTKSALRPGAKLVIELPDRDRTVKALVHHEQLGPTKVSRHFDTESSIITERFELDPTNIFVLRYRVFGRTELVEMVSEAGFTVREIVDQGLVTPPMTLTTMVAERPTRV